MDFPDMRLTELHDDDKMFAVRICMLVSEADPHLINRNVSVIQMCGECERDVWVDTSQENPTLNPDTGEPLDGEHNLCLDCAVMHAQASGEPMQFFPNNGKATA